MSELKKIVKTMIYIEKNKLRLIDPSIYIENKIYRSSEISLEIKELSKKALEKSIKGTYIKIL